MRPGDNVAVELLELRLRLFQGELLVSGRLLKHLPACSDATKGAAGRHGLDVGVEELLRRVQIMCDDSLDELSCAGELHRRNLLCSVAGTARRLEEALALWRGPRLADFTYESFAQDEIHRLEELRLFALEDRLEGGAWPA
jgi:Bacterial transcriptional activator domain